MNLYDWLYLPAILVVSVGYWSHYPDSWAGLIGIMVLAYCAGRAAGRNH